MDNLDKKLAQAENLAKLNLLLEVMEDLRQNGHVDLHLKYMEKYDSLKKECKEFKNNIATKVA